MSDYSDLISQSFGRSNPALPTAVGNINDDPDKAQRALDLAKATGVPSTAIYGDLEEFERQNKAMLASDIVANNPHIGDFIQSDPMVPKIANDDYGNLDAVSQHVTGLGLASKATSAANSLSKLMFDGDPLKRWKEGGPLGSWLTSENIKNYPIMSAVAAGLGTPIELFFRGVGGAIETAADVTVNVTSAAGAPGLGRELGAMLEAEAMGLTGRHSMAHTPVVDAMTRVRPWIENGREPPPTVLPEYDAFRAKQNAEDVQGLIDATQEAQQSLVRERSPELFRQFIAQHTDAEVSIGGDVVAALYGDKLPTKDDGILGWVPGIEDKLTLAKSAGDDVSIPLADWLTHIDPEVMKALHDDIRVRPNGITAREAATPAEPPVAPLPETVPTYRAATSLEPLLSIGDRKLSLTRAPNKAFDPRGIAENAGVDYTGLSPEVQRSLQEQADRNKAEHIAQGFHDFHLLDEQGNPVGYLNISEQKDGKRLYVDMISGINGLGARDFGPALMRDMLRQIKAEFPNAESIAGHRVSGAREKAGKDMFMPAAVVKLDNPKGWETAEASNEFRRVLEGGQWETYSRNLQAYIKPHAVRSMEDRKLITAVNDELRRIIPQKVSFGAADRITSGGGIQGQYRNQTIEPTGVYLTHKEAYPIILYSLEGTNPLYSARHEAIHHLRQYGFFNPQEWGILERAANESGWMDRFHIHDRYPTGQLPLKLEEAIAEAYPAWKNGLLGVHPEVKGIFAKMKAFFDGLRERIAQLLGKDPTWEDIFQRIDTGEIGSRADTLPRDPRAFNEWGSVPEDPSRVYERANSLGMPIGQFKEYDKLIQKQHAEDVAAATKRAEAQQAREQTKQWKDDRKALRAEVSKDIRQRPDVAADLFLGAGELYGQKIARRYQLDADALSPEQKAALPKEYYAKDGLAPDDVANIFGYGSGDAMVQKLAEYNTAKMSAQMTAKDFVSRVTDIETDRQMRIKYGVLEDNIMDAVKEQVSGETELNKVHEETLYYGTKIGQLPATRENIHAAVRQEFQKISLGNISSDRFMRRVGQLGRAIEAAHRSEDWAEAFRLAQQREYALTLAHEAVKAEKEIAKFDKVAKRFTKREVPSVDPAYTNFIHDILMRVGKPVRRSIQDLQTEIEAGEYKTLQDFVEGKETHGLREVPVADILLDPAFRKKFEDLTVDEFRAVDASIKTLVKNGRDEKKITKAGVEADLQDIKDQMIEQLKLFQERTYDAKGGRWMGPIPPKLAKGLRTYGISHIQMENLFNRWDHDDPNGVFQQYVMRDLVDSANNESALTKQYAEKLRSITDKSDLKKSVDNPLFKVPGTDTLMKFNRGNLRTIMLNMGNDSNFSKLARGYKLEPTAIRAWVDQHATKADWDWVQRIGDVFAELKAEVDVMYRNISGVAPESLALQPIQTVHGEYPGWYYPVIYHPEFEGPSKKLMGPNALEQEGFVRATTPSGYTQRRTGYAGPMALDLDIMPSRMKQMIHDLAMRPAVINASKIFYDKDVRGAVFKHFGTEWRDMLVPYLVDVANSANYVPKAQRQFYNASEFIRQNMISTLVGLNPGTVLKHGPTAFVQSLHEVGTVNFLKAMKSLTSINERTGESNWAFAQRESQELQRRHQNYIETLGGAAHELMPQGKYMSLRSTIQSLSAKPVALSDLLSAVPTWLAQYEKTIGEGSSHGDAVYMADRAVRRAHGSVAITNRSGVMRGGAAAQWLASVYGFFNHIMNRQYELLWKAGETMDLAKKGEYREAMQRAPELTSMLFAYVLAPALIEEMVTPLASTDNESWGKKAAKGIAFTLGASWIGVRDVANAILNGRDPSVGLASTALKTVTDLARDLAKDRPLSKEHAGKVIKDGATLMGTLSGVVPAQAGKVAEFAYGVNQGTERPNGPWGWLVGSRYGTLKNHSKTFEEWQRHH